MRALLRCAVLVLLASTAVSAQQPPTASAPSPDPFGRETPRGTVSGFAFAARSGDYDTASRYLQLTPAQRRDALRLARELESVIDRYFTQRVTSLSDARDGDVRDGLPLDRDRITLAAGSQTVDVLLVHVTDADARPIWLFSSESLARMASFDGVGNDTWIEGLMPSLLTGHSLFDVSLAHWAIWVASFALPFLILIAAGAIAVRVIRRRESRPPALDLWYRRLKWPVTLATTLLVHWLAIPWLGIPFSIRLMYGRWSVVVFGLVVAWLTWRFLALSFARARVIALRRHRTSAVSLMLLLERVAKAVLVLIVILGLLNTAGLDMTTALAGVGIGGIAVALGAQKSVENLLGGVFLLADGALAVGDFCTISGRSGWVEDITLRSVRLRTVEQTLVSIPAGVLAQTSIENFVTRGKMLIQATLPLQYGATSTQVRAVLDGVAALLSSDPDLEAVTSRVRLVNLGPAAIELELYAYVRTSEMAQFVRVRERLLLDVFTIVESAGARFARPTELIVSSSDTAGSGLSTTSDASRVQRQTA